MEGYIHSLNSETSLRSFLRFLAPSPLLAIHIYLRTTTPTDLLLVTTAWTSYRPRHFPPFKLACVQCSCPCPGVALDSNNLGLGSRNPRLEIRRLLRLAFQTASHSIHTTHSRRQVSSLPASSCLGSHVFLIPVSRLLTTTFPV